MSIYTVHVPPGEGSREARAAGIRFVRDGVSLAALLVPPLWAIWHRLWLVLAGWIAAVVLVEVAARQVDETAAGIVGFVFSIWFAVVARDLHRWTLDRRGYEAAAVVEGRDREAAERRFFEAWLAPAAPAAPRPPAPPRSAAPSAGPIGLFPTPGGRSA